MAGGGGLAERGEAVEIRRLRAADLAAAERLRAQAGWNHRPADWRRLLDWEPAGCFAAWLDGRLVGTATATALTPRLGFVGMVLVDVEQRRRGIGRALTSRAVEWLERERGCACVALYATPLGRPLYEHLGFGPEYGLQRWEGVAPSVSAPPEVRPLLLADLPRLADLDRLALGVDRGRLWPALLAARPEGAYWIAANGGVRGFACVRPGARCWYLGPFLATDASAAETLLRAALAPLAGQAVGLDCPDPNVVSQSLLPRFGFAPIRPFICMTRGQRLPPSDPSRVYGVAGLEIG